MRDQLEVLQNAVLFEEVPDVELRAIGANVRTLALRAGETLAVRGQPLAGMVLVEDGALEVMLDSSPICTLSPGSVFCEDALVSDALSPATVRAATASRIGLLDRSRLVADLGRLPQIRRALEQAWRRRVLAAGLYRIDLFQMLTAEARSVLLERFERFELPPGTVLTTAGETSDTFTFIRAGEAQLHLDRDPDGPADAPEFAELKVGDYLSESGLIDESPQTATITTAAGLTAMQLTRAQFEEALSSLPGQLDELKALLQQRSEAMF